MKWTVTPVLAGEFGMVRDDIKFEGGNPAIAGMVPSVLFLLEAAGRQVVVDTGFDDPRRVEETMGLVAKRDGSYADVLRRAGIDAGKVEAVILTHTHWDHAANCHLFPAARIFCQRADWDYAFSARAGYGAALLAMFAANERRFVLLDGGGELLPGIRCAATGGHTPGSQLLFVDAPGGQVTVCGDEVMTVRNVREQVAVGLSDNRERIAAALRLVLAQHGGWFLPSHDDAVLTFGANPEKFRIH